MLENKIIDAINMELRVMEIKKDTAAVKIVTDFINHVSNYNLYVLHTNVSFTAIMAFISDTSERQDVILSFLTSYSVKLRLNGIDTDELASNIAKDILGTLHSTVIDEKLIGLATDDSVLVKIDKAPIVLPIILMNLYGAIALTKLSLFKKEVE